MKQPYPMLVPSLRNVLTHVCLKQVHKESPVQKNLLKSSMLKINWALVERNSSEKYKRQWQVSHRLTGVGIFS